jgi:hypothetical protein
VADGIGDSVQVVKPAAAFGQIAVNRSCSIRGYPVYSARGDVMTPTLNNSAQIASLQQARAIPLETDIRCGPGRPRGTVALKADVVAQRPPKRKKMSAEAGARIDAAQRAHCAKLMKRGEVDRKIFIIACTP